MRIHLERPTARRRDEFLQAARRSRRLHSGWASPPKTEEQYTEYLRKFRSDRNSGFLVVTADGELAGVIAVNEIVRGSFQSAYLGYYAFVPHAGCGYMKEGLRRVVRHAFSGAPSSPP